MKIIMNIIKNMVTIAVFITSHQTFLHAQEKKRNEFSGDYAAIFNDTPIIADERNFAEEYPDLAYGFMLVDLNFQEFMANKLNNHLAYEPTESSKRQKTSLLDNAITAAEDEIKRPLFDKFHEKLFTTIVNNKNPNKIRAKHFIYTRESSLFKDDLLSEIQNPSSRYQKILITALMKDNHTYIEFLIKLGVDLTSLNFSQNKSLLLLALSYESKKIVTALIQAPQININEIHETLYGKKSTLHMAISMQNIKLVTSLLNHQNIDINIADDLGISPLMQTFIGSYKDKDTIIDLLLQRPEINIHQKDYKRQNVLHFVTMYANNNKYIKIFTDAGLDVNTTDKYGWTPLHIAIHNNQFYNAQTLLDHGADKNMLARKPYLINDHTPLTCLDLATTEEMRNILNNYQPSQNAVTL